jgi:hypothetical protein
MKYFYLFSIIIYLLLLIDSIDASVGKVIGKILQDGAKRAVQSWKERVKNTPQPPPNQPARQKSPSSPSKSPSK